MNKLSINRLVIFLIAFAAISSLASCVNEEYDLSKGLETDVTVLQNVALPLGNVPPVSINTLLGETGSQESVLNVDEDGNLYLSFGNDVLSQTFTIPEVEVGGDGGIRFDDNVEVKFIPKYKGYPLGGLKIDQIPSYIPKEIHFSQTEADGKELERSFSIDLHKELPEQIVSIDQVHLDATIFYTFRVSPGTVLHLAEGFTMRFPEFMVIEKPEGAVNYDVINGAVIFTKDTRISDDEPFILEIHFIRMDVPEDAIVSDGQKDPKRYIDFKDASVDVKGDLYLLLDDYAGSTIPDMTTLTMDIQIENLKMKSAHVMLDLDIQIEDKEIVIGELPDLFGGEGTVVDLYNPMLRFKLHNDSPFEMYLNANITSYTDNHQFDIHIGDCTPYFDGKEHEEHSTEPVVIYADQDVEYFFSRKGMHDGDTGIDIMLDKIGDIIKELPEKIMIHDVLVETSEEFINIEANKECGVEMEYEFISPLAFGEDLNISLDYDIDLGLDGDAIGLDEIRMDMDLFNTIPLDFEIKGVALGADGNELKNTTVDMDIKLAGGTLDNPAKSPVEIVLKNEARESIATLRLKLKASSSQTLQGKVLNTEQGLEIKSINIALPKGITLDLAGTDDESN